MILRIVIWVLIVFFPVSDFAVTVLKRSKSPTSKTQDRGSLYLIWLGVTIGVLAAIRAESLAATRISAPSGLLHPIALILLLAGLGIRWWSIIVLGRYFTADVAVQQQQPVVQSGPYRFARHPSYAGALIAFLGIGVFMSNWLSLVVLFLPVALAMLNRIRVEEHALLSTLGAPYADYRAHTKRLIPGIY